MSRLPERFVFPLPEHWTPQQALAVFALLHELTDAIWCRYEADLLPLVDPVLNTDTDPQLDLFGPDDDLPF
jgi:hypothetical protein